MAKRLKGMRLVLVVSDNCGGCDGAEKALAHHIKKGEIEVINLDNDEEAVSLLSGAGFCRIDGDTKVCAVPKLLVVDKKGEVFAELPISD